MRTGYQTQTKHSTENHLTGFFLWPTNWFDIVSLSFFSLLLHQQHLTRIAQTMCEVKSHWKYHRVNYRAARSISEYGHKAISLVVKSPKLKYSLEFKWFEFDRFMTMMTTKKSHMTHSNWQPFCVWLFFFSLTS